MKNKKGFTVLGVVVTLSILAAMGAGIAHLVAANQATRTATLRSDQAFRSPSCGLG